MTAARSGNVSVVGQLLAEGADPNACAERSVERTRESTNRNRIRGAADRGERKSVVAEHYLLRHLLLVQIQPMPSAASYIRDLQARGRYHFTTEGWGARYSRPPSPSTGPPCETQYEGGLARSDLPVHLSGE